MTSKATNPWRYGDITETIAKFQGMGMGNSNVVVKTFQIAREILGILDAIEREDARRAEEREAAIKFRKQFEAQ